MGQIQSIGVMTSVADSPGDFTCYPMQTTFVPMVLVDEPLHLCGRAWFEYDMKGDPNRIVGQAGIKVELDSFPAWVALPFRKNGKTKYRGKGLNKTYCEEGGLTEENVCVVEETSIRADQLPQVVVENTGKGLFLKDGYLVSGQVLYADTIMMAFEDEDEADVPQFTWAALGEAGSINGYEWL